MPKELNDSSNRMFKITVLSHWFPMKKCSHTRRAGRPDNERSVGGRAQPNINVIQPGAFGGVVIGISRILPNVPLTCDQMYERSIKNFRFLCSSKYTQRCYIIWWDVTLMWSYIFSRESENVTLYGTLVKVFKMHTTCGTTLH